MGAAEGGGSGEGVGGGGWGGNKPFNTLMRAQASVPLAVWFLSPLSQRTSPKAGAASPLPYTSFSTPRSIVPDDFQHC